MCLKCPVSLTWGAKVPLSHQIFLISQWWFIRWGEGEVLRQAEITVAVLFGGGKKGKGLQDEFPIAVREREG